MDRSSTAPATQPEKQRQNRGTGKYPRSPGPQGLCDYLMSSSSSGVGSGSKAIGEMAEDVLNLTREMKTCIFKKKTCGPFSKIPQRASLSSPVAMLPTTTATGVIAQESQPPVHTLSRQDFKYRTHNLIPLMKMSGRLSFYSELNPGPHSGRHSSSYPSPGDLLDPVVITAAAPGLVTHP